jgi:hypothetical protein
MLGLRAFGRDRIEPGPTPSPQPEAPPAGALLGLRPLSSTPPPSVGAPPLLQSPFPGADRTPPRVPLPPPVGSEPPPRQRRTDPDRAAERPSKASDSTPGRRAAGRRASGRRRAQQERSSWWLGALVALGVLGGAVAVVVVVARMRAHPQGNTDGPVPSASAGASASAEVRITSPTTSAGKLVNDDERFRALLAQIHGHGGKESPELKALVDEQAALQSRLVGMRQCDADPATCQAWAKARRTLVGPATQVPLTRRPTATPDQLQPQWMAGLKMPDIPIADDVRVRRVFEYLTENQVGRERVQSMLFRCGAYRDAIQATLVRYDLPMGLQAVAFAESGCAPTATSVVGARGMWQFMPDAGRAYHLRIIQDALDERLSPPKETEAAARYYSDLYKKFGAWDLAFAAYNMGPFGLLARLNRAEPGVGFWDLVDADALPDETAGYVPNIEAFALILNNLQKLKFAGTQMRAPEVTADLDAAPGTRLSLIARAAATSVVQLRAWNLDILGDRVPTVPGERFSVQVSKDVVWQARDTLAGLIAQGSIEDQCVPDNFDWGKQRFTQDMVADCRRRLTSPMR